MMKIRGLFLILVAAFACGDGTTSLTNDTTTNDDGSGAVETVSEVESKIFTLINTERTSRGLEALTRRSDLDQVARRHSEDMRDRDFFSHENPDGQNSSARITAAGITWSATGENIAYSMGQSTGRAENAVEGWMNSAGHKANILDENDLGFTQTGVGVSFEESTLTYHYTQVFIKP